MAPAPNERGSRFLEMVSYLYTLEGGCPEFPVEGTDVKTTFLRPKDPEYTICVLKVSDSETKLT